jgi:hypothetical protein
MDQLKEWENRAIEAQRRAAQAYARLLELAERHDSGQVRTVATFLAATFNGSDFPFDLFDLRTLDVALADDALACIDALRWGKADLYKLVPDGEARVAQVIKDWGLMPGPASPGL